MNESEKKTIVSAYFSAADAMVTLGALATVGPRNNVVPFTSARDKGQRSSLSLQDEIYVWDASLDEGDSLVGRDRCVKQKHQKLPNAAKPAKSHRRSRGGAVVTTHPNHQEFGVQGRGGGRSSALVFWEDFAKHQWMLEVLEELEVFALENSLAGTAEALVAARCEIISLSAR